MMQTATCELCGPMPGTGYTCYACASRMMDLALADDPSRLSGPDWVGGGPDNDQEPAWYQHFEVCRRLDGSLWELGRGAMGITYKAFDTNLRAPVALKIISAAFTNDAEARERFLREARAAALLRHPNVANVLHLGQQGGNCFYAMEFIEGETLFAHVVENGPIPCAAALRMVCQIARALVAAHQSGFIHRDIKPSNVMLAAGRGGDLEESTVKVIDFGMVKALALEPALEQWNLANAYFVGTPSFASPEQLSAGMADSRSDIYALGATWLFMLVGEERFQAMFQGEAGSTGTPEHKLKVPGKELPKGVASLLRSMLEPDPALRPQSAGELLVKAQEQLEILTHPRRISAARRWQILALTLFAAVSIVICLWAGALAAPGLTAKDKTIAILPFGSPSALGSPESLLGASIPEDIAGRLSKVEELQVAAMDSAMIYGKTGNPRDAAKRLGVRWIVAGEVRRVGAALRMDCRLIDASSNRQVWSKSFDCKENTGDIFSLELAVAQEVLRTLGIHLSATERLSIAMKPTEQMDAYTAYARGRQHALRFTREDNEAAVSYYAKALEADSDYALAHAALAEALCHGVRRAWSPPATLNQAIASAQKAISLEGSSPEGYTALGLIRATQELPWEALAETRRALVAKPHHLPAMRNFGLLWTMAGQPQKGLPWLNAAARLDPANAVVWCSIADAYKDLCVDDEAEKHFARCKSSDPNQVFAECGLIHLHLLQDEFSRARHECESVLIKRPDYVLALTLSAQIDFFEGKNAEAEAKYRKLIEKNRSGDLTYYGGIRYLSALGYLLKTAGKTTEAEILLGEAAKLDEGALQDGPAGAYDLAATCAAQERKEEALAYLSRAIKDGWIDYRSTALDPRFRVLDGEPAYQTLLGEVHAKVDQMRSEAARLSALPLNIAHYPVAKP